LVTGATGYLGSALVKYWARAGHNVTALVRSSSPAQRLSPSIEGVQLLPFASDEELIKLILDSRPEVVVHTACSYGRAGESLTEIFDANFRFGLLVIQGILGASNSRVSFVNTSTALDPFVGVYALSKSQFARFAELIAHQSSAKLQFINVNLQHFYGPCDDEYKFPTKVLRALLRNEAFIALTEGSQQRDFIFIDDVVSAYDSVLRNLGRFSLVDNVDIGSGSAPTIRQFVELMHSLVNSKTSLRFGCVPIREHEQMICKADTSRLRSLGWTSLFDLEAGLSEMIRLERMK
jgi:CDP-paratose synthetase